MELNIYNNPDFPLEIKEEHITDNRYEIYRMPYELLLGMLIRQYIWSNINTQYISFYRNRTFELESLWDLVLAPFWAPVWEPCGLQDG